MNFEKFNALVESRLNYGEVDSPNVVSEYKNIGCGDGYRLFLKTDNDIITHASYTTTGCSFSLASLAIICELVKGKSLEEASQITPEMMESFIDGYPERRRNYAVTAIQALNKAISDLRNGTGLPAEKMISRENTLKKLQENGHLRGENLSSVMLNELDLSGTDFSGANLQNAFLRGSNLTGAIFTGANLRGAFLNDTVLSGTDFTEADLRFAKLHGAKIENAVFDNALYDIGTRVETKNMYIFDKMQQKGKELYLASSL